MLIHDFWTPKDSKITKTSFVSISKQYGSRRASSRGSHLVTTPAIDTPPQAAAPRGPILGGYPSHAVTLQEENVTANKNKGKWNGDRAFLPAIHSFLAWVHPLQTSNQVRPAWVLKTFPLSCKRKERFGPPPHLLLSSGVCNCLQCWVPRWASR